MVGRAHDAQHFYLGSALISLTRKQLAAASKSTKQSMVTFMENNYYAIRKIKGLYVFHTKRWRNIGHPSSHRFSSYALNFEGAVEGRATLSFIL
jgi:hypothetical protein